MFLIRGEDFFDRRYWGGLAFIFLPQAPALVAVPAVISEKLFSLVRYMKTRIGQEIYGVICGCLVFPLIEDLLALPVICQSFQGYRGSDNVSCKTLPAFGIVGNNLTLITLSFCFMCSK